MMLDLDTIYRFSGYTFNLVMLLLAFLSYKNGMISHKKYFFISIYIYLVAILNVIGIILASTLSNNLFFDYLYVPLIFTFSTLYLASLHKSKILNYIISFCILFFFIFQFYQLFDSNMNKQFNSSGAVTSSIFTFLFAFWNLTTLFKMRTGLRMLRNNPSFWFTVTLFCFSFVGLVVTTLAEISYFANNLTALRFLFITDNLLSIFFLYGFYKGVKLSE